MAHPAQSSFTPSTLIGGVSITPAADPFSSSAPVSLCGSRPGTGENPGRGNLPGIEGLNAVQLRLLCFIAGYLEAHDGVSPSLTQMADAVGYRSRSAPHRHLDVLEQRGWLRRRRYRSCAIELLHAPAIPRSAYGAPMYFVPVEMLSIHGGCNA